MMNNLHNILFALAFLLIAQITVKCNAGEALSGRNKKIQVSQKYKQKSSAASSNYDNLFTKRRVTLQRTTHNISSTGARNLKKWQLDKVTRKQYEIINILWKKTKLFINFDTSTATYKPRLNGTPVLHTQQDHGSNQMSPSHSSLQTSTSSYIEFYYLDETNVYIQPNETQTSLNFNRNDKTINQFTLKFNKINNTSQDNSVRNTDATEMSKFIYTVAELFIVNKTCPYTTQPHVTMDDPKRQRKQKPNTKLYVEQTTIYDKIKFFEIYDKHTVPYPKKTNHIHEHEAIDDDKENNTTLEQKILLEHIDQGIGYDHDSQHKTKKHIRESFQNKSILCNGNKNPKLKNLFSITIPEKINRTYLSNPIKHVPNESQTLYSYINKSVLWAEYPFAAVYIYEPARVHCDAAGISPHWLVTAGACLSRHHENPSGAGRSAFVAFCGGSWWQPERVAYVKYSLVHPRYHPVDRIRRQLYNIGVVQVVISMLSCVWWAPIPLMSHQYTTGQKGTPAIALGWGLDRYETRYAFIDLPKWPLMIYEGMVYSDSCPGNIGYSDTKRVEEERGMKNTYCLSLPPYTGEENDPIHGSLLLVGGKLMALYLQEERRSWGDQSAQYTGTWRLIPWVLDVAREPEHEDSFTLEI